MGYVAGLKEVHETEVGDTITTVTNGATQPLPGYKEVKPMVFSGLYPTNADDLQSCATRSISCG